MVCGVHIAMRSHSSHFSLFQRVSVSLSNVPFPMIYDLDAASKDYADKADFRKFCRQLFHTSLECILSSLREHMTAPCITHCADGHYRRVIYGLGPYIADYPEQALLACVVQNWCPKYASLLRVLLSTHQILNQDALPHPTILTEEMEVLILICTQIHCYALEQSHYGNSGTATGL